MGRFCYCLFLLTSVAVIWNSTAAYGQEFLSCFSKETLDLVRSIVTDRLDYAHLFVGNNSFTSDPRNPLGFKDIATAERTPGYVSCKLTAIDKKTGQVRSYLNYNVARTNQRPYVTVYFYSRPDRQNTSSLADGACTPLLGQALAIPSETSCIEPYTSPEVRKATGGLLKP